MSLLAPWGLLLGLLAGPLVALYLVRLRKHRHVVPSTLLWRRVAVAEQRARPCDRLRRHLLLLLQLLLLLLLMLALARPVLETRPPDGRAIVLVVDVSASMGATDVRPHRLGRAVREARAILDTLSPEDRAMLVEAGPRVQVRVPFTTELRQVERELASLAPTQARGNLRDGVALALAAAEGHAQGQVVILSDGVSGPLSDLSRGNVPVRFMPIGTSDANSGIVGMDLRSPTGLDPQLMVTLQHFGGSPTEAYVDVFFDGRRVERTSLTLPPREPTPWVTSLPDGGGQLEVRLHADDNHLAADDVAHAVLPRARRQRILLVDGDPWTRRALQADSRVRLIDRGFPPQEQDLARADALITQAPVPDGAEHLPVAILGPVDGPVTFEGPEQDVSPVTWRRHHPLMRHVDWRGSHLAGSRVAREVGTLVPVLEGPRGGLIFAGQARGRRQVQLAFDPRESDLPLRVAWPVFLLNTVSWLTEQPAAGPPFVEAGEPFVRRLDRDAEPSLAIDAPSGAAPKWHVDEAGGLRITDLHQVGVYTLEGQGWRSAFGVNLLSEAESDIAPRDGLELYDGETRAARSATLVQRELWRLLIGVGIILLLVEWAFYNRRSVV